MVRHSKCFDEVRGMKILALVTDGFGSDGGIARYNCDLMSALIRSRYVEKVSVLPRFGDCGALRPANVFQFDALPNVYHWAAVSSHVVLRGGFDLIFCGHLNAAPFVARLARFVGKPFWVQAHGIEAWEDRGAKFRRALTSAKLVTAVSRHTRQRLLSWSDIHPSRVSILPNTFNHVYAPSAKRPDLVSRYGLEGQKIILTVGRMSASERYKGHDRIIRCLDAVRSVVPVVRYLIVGTGDDQPRLEALSSDLGVRNAVVFTGHVPPDEIVDHYALADVFAMPSTGEGFGIVFLEAAASGLPVIGGSRDGSVDALADGAIGAAVEPDDLPALTVAIVTALNCHSRRPPHAIQRFDFSNFANHVNDLAQRLQS